MSRSSIIEVSTVEETLEVAAKIGANLRGGEVIELVSDVGGGKTTFVRGAVRGAGSADHVSSPSFTISNEYRAGALRIYHFDFYRLTEPGIMKQELAEVITDPQAVVIVEWADIVEDVLPEDHIKLTIATTAETSRQFSLESGPSREYIAAGIA
jgi:tRNA threonylcarbamoyladenosine biosynthesis protein TsaE